MILKGTHGLNGVGNRNWGELKLIGAGSGQDKMVLGVRKKGIE